MVGAAGDGKLGLGPSPRHTRIDMLLAVHLNFVAANAFSLQEAILSLETSWNMVRSRYTVTERELGVRYVPPGEKNRLD